MIIINLIKSIWTKQDIENFYAFEKTLKSNKSECDWEKKIVNTNLECFGKTSQKAKSIAKEIKKGNFLSFIENFNIKTHFDSILLAYLICYIKDFDLFENHLSKFVKTIDNWASCDTLKFSKRDEKKLFNISKKFLNSEQTFVRRVGLDIFFELIKLDDYVDKCFDVLNDLQTEQEYYVNMCAAWLLAECFIKHREKTLKYFENNTANNFIINKAISKCRDSFRVSQKDKTLLLKFKRK